MSNKIQLRLLLVILALAVISGCGGRSESAPAPSKAVVKISTSGSIANSLQIGGIDVLLTLPSGVSVQSAPDPAKTSVLVTNAGMVSASGTAAGTNTAVMGIYTAATGSVPGSVAIHVADPNGFGTGEFVTVTCDLTSGVRPAGSDFRLSGLNVVDPNGVAIAGLTPALTEELQ